LKKGMLQVLDKNWRISRALEHSADAYTCIVPGLTAFSTTLHNARDTAQRPPAVRKVLRRDRDGWDEDGIDEEGYNELGFDENGVNRSGQLLANFPPDFMKRAAAAAAQWRADGKVWVSPVSVDEDFVKKEYPKWYEQHEAIWPARSQVSCPGYLLTKAVRANRA
jgi:hypothetical protein